MLDHPSYDPRSCPGRAIVSVNETSVPAYSADADVPTVLHTHTIPAGGLYVVNDSLVFEYHGNFAAALGATSQLTLTLGALGILDTGLFTAATGGAYLLRGRLIRAADGSGLGFAMISSADVNRTADISIGANFDVASDLILTGQGHTANDVSLVCMAIDFRPVRP